MKDISGSIIVFFIALFAFIKLAGPIPFSMSSVVTQKTDSFTVSGEGKATIIPDIAVVSAGVQAQGASVKVVQQELNTKINRISESVKKLGIDKADIQTANYNLSPMYDYKNGTQKITGYEANSMLMIRVKNIDKANDVVDSATAGGANQIGGISFDVADRTKAENQARELAVAEAKNKASIAAKTAGFTLGRVINYSEGNDSGGRPVPMMAKAESMDVASAPTRIEPGSSEIVMTVSLSYEIR